MERPDAILVGDIHYREDQPRCRLDDFWQTQKRKALWLRGLWEDTGRPPVLQPGDLFHRWKSPPSVISAVLEYLPPMVTMPGNPGRHNYFTEEGFYQDALYTILLSSNDWTILTRWVPRTVFKELPITVVSSQWGEYPPIMKPDGLPNILLTHKMILDGPAPFDGEHGLDFLKRMTGYDLILTGHNHKPMEFAVHAESKNILPSAKKRWLVNPGSFTRQTADETHLPRVYLWYAKDNEVKPIYVPIEEGVVSRDHIDDPKARDDRIAAFVEKLDGSDMDITVSFRLNVEELLRSGAVRAKVEAKVREVVGGDVER